MTEDDFEEHLAAGARLDGQSRRREGGLRTTDPYPDARRIGHFRRQLTAMLDDMDGSISVAELRELLETGP